ncbi:MAG: hypothetical protein ACM34H_05715, partial [Deltaproteobacteria bacterium]
MAPFLYREASEPDVTSIIRDRVEATLSRDVSHLLVGMFEKSPAGAVRSHLLQQGIAVQEETTFEDEQGRTWLVLSIPLADISHLVLELIEKGISGNIQGINASA